MQEKTLDELAISYKGNDNESEFLEIMRRMRPLIKKRSSAFRGQVSDDDIEQAAVLGVLTCLLRYEPEKGAFAAYAVSYILAALRREYDLTSITTVPQHERARTIMGHASRHISVEMAGGATTREAVDSFAAKTADHINPRRRITAQDVERVMSIRSGEDMETASEAVEHALPDDQQKVIAAAMRALSPAERTVIRERYLREDPASVYDAGREAGICFQNVSRVARRSLLRMRAALEADGITADDVLA